jgi:hypothetical protein
MITRTDYARSHRVRLRFSAGLGAGYRAEYRCARRSHLYGRSREIGDQSERATPVPPVYVRTESIAGSPAEPRNLERRERDSQRHTLSHVIPSKLRIIPDTIGKSADPES